MIKTLKLPLLTLLILIIASCQSPSNTNSSSSPSSSNSSSPTPVSSEQPSNNTSPTASPNTGSGLQFSFVGVDADKVSPGDNIIPDNAKDLHFTANYTFSGESEIKLVAINKYENGKPNLSIGWAAGTALNWVVAIEANGTAFNNTKNKFLNKLSGNVKFDFYGSDLAGFGLTQPGTSYQLNITYNDASGKETKINQVTTL